MRYTVEYRNSANKTFAGPWTVCRDLIDTSIKRVCMSHSNRPLQRLIAMAIASKAVDFLYCVASIHNVYSVAVRWQDENGKDKMAIMKTT